MSKASKITVFGAANVDITGFPDGELVYKDANIGSMKSTAGGVGRNIAENLKHLDFDVELISIFGDDPLSDFLIKDCQSKGLKIARSLFLNNMPASTFIAILDHQNDLAVGISAMQLYDDLDDTLFISNLPHQIDSEYIILETNLSNKILQKIVEKYPDKKFVLDTVSGKKALRAKTIMQHLHILKTNLLEAETMSGIKVQNDKDLEKLVSYFIVQGVTKVFITLGKQGVIYGTKKFIEQQKPVKAEVKNTIGAGDSFVAGLVYADILQKSMKDMAAYGMRMAALTVSHDEAVNPNISRDKVEQLVANGQRI